MGIYIYCRGYIFYVYVIGNGISHLIPFSAALANAPCSSMNEGNYDTHESQVDSYFGLHRSTSDSIPVSDIWSTYTGLTSKIGTTMVNGLPQDQTTPLSTKLEINGSLINLRVEETHNSRYIQPNCFTPPTLHSKALVKRHCASLECCDAIKIIAIREVSFACPWWEQYELLPSHLKRIIGPCPSPPQCFQHINSLTKIRSTSDGSVLHSQGFQGWLIAKFDNEVFVQDFGATDGRIEDVRSHGADICGNIATFTILTLIRKVYGFCPLSSNMYVTTNLPSMPHGRMKT
jgi:hypothetical protein